MHTVLAGRMKMCWICPIFPGTVKIYVCYSPDSSSNKAVVTLSGSTSSACGKGDTAQSGTEGGLFCCWDQVNPCRPSETARNSMAACPMIPSPEVHQHLLNVGEECSARYHHQSVPKHWGRQIIDNQCPPTVGQWRPIKTIGHWLYRLDDSSFFSLRITVFKDLHPLSASL